jgi:hypothetical protein
MVLSFQRNVAYFSYLGQQETEKERLWKERTDWKLFVPDPYKNKTMTDDNSVIYIIISVTYQTFLNKW